MRHLLLLLLMLGATLPSYAQIEAPVKSARPRVAFRAADADTIRAIHNLFASRRGRAAAVGLGGTAILVGSAAVYGDAQVRQGHDFFSAGDYAMMGGVLAVLPLTWGGLTALEFNARTEAQTIQRYQAGEPLPRFIRRRLKSRYFRP
jgi:hypothetical protein